MPRLDDRIREDLIDREQALWMALGSDAAASAVKALCLPRANLMFPEMDVIRVEDEDDLKDAMESKFHRFDTFELQDVDVIVIGLMAGVITYTVDASRGKNRYEATGSSTWGQGSDGQWRLAAHSETQL